MRLTLRTRTALFFLWVLCAVAASFQAFWSLVDLLVHDDVLSYVVLIPMVSAVLVFQQRGKFFEDVYTDGVLGGTVALLGLSLIVAGRVTVIRLADAALAVETGGLVTLAIGGFLVFYGRRAARAAIFPLAFLAFMIPVPRPLIDAATQILKVGSRDAVSVLFTLTGTPFYREGFTYTLPSAVIEIADECSGIHSSIALFLTSLIVSYLFLQTSWKRALVILAALPLAVIKNGIRIVSLSLLAMYVDPSFLTGSLHHEGGIVFFLIALVVIAPLVILLHSSEAPFQGHFNERCTDSLS